MKPTVLMIALLLCVNTEAFSQTTITTTGDCSPAVGQNTGMIIINCNNTDPSVVELLNQLKPIKDYNQNIKELARIKKSTEELEAAIKSVAKKSDHGIDAAARRIRELQNLVVEKDIEYRQVFQEHKILLHSAAEELAKLQEINGTVTKDLITEFKSGKGSFKQDLRREIGLELERQSSVLLDQINDSLRMYYLTLNRLENKVEQMEHDVAFLLKEIRKGDFKGPLFFTGISIGGTYLDDAFRPKLSLEIELFLPNLHLFELPVSTFVEAAAIDWEIENQTTTLPGLEPRTETVKNNVLYLGIGTKFFWFRFRDELQIYSGAVFGHSIAGEENTYYLGPISGVEIFHKAMRIALELRYDLFSNIEESTRTFRPFGDSISDTSREQKGGAFLGAKVLFRL